MIIFSFENNTKHVFFYTSSSFCFLVAKRNECASTFNQKKNRFSLFNLLSVVFFCSSQSRWCDEKERSFIVVAGRMVLRQQYNRKHTLSSLPIGNDDVDNNKIHLWIQSWENACEHTLMSHEWTKLKQTYKSIKYKLMFVSDNFFYGQTREYIFRHVTRFQARTMNILLWSMFTFGQEEILSSFTIAILMIVCDRHCKRIILQFWIIWKTEKLNMQVVCFCFCSISIACDKCLEKWPILPREKWI